MSLTDGEKRTAERAAGGQVLSTGIARLYFAAPPSWNYYATGAAIFTYQPPSHYIKVVDMDTNSIIFNQELYNEFSYMNLTPFFGAFESDDNIIGLSFADDYESKSFSESILSFKSKSPNLTRSMQTIPLSISSRDYGSPQMSTSSPDLLPSRSNPDDNSFETSKQKKDREKQEKKKEKEMKKKQKKGPKGTIKEITGPTKVVHNSHIGWDPKSGFQIRNIPPEWKELFKAAGVRPAELKNPETAAFIMTTVATAISRPPPPPPSGQVPLTQSRGRSPPSAGGPPPARMARAPPPIPPPQGYDPFAYPQNSAPPPAPDLPEDDDQPPASNSFLAAIQSKQLKKADPSENKGMLPSLDSEQGTTLLHTLSSAMAQRRINIKEDDKGDDDDDGGDDDDWDP